MLITKNKFLTLMLMIFILIMNSFVATGQFDLREANVTEIIFEKIENTQYNFFVTLYHDDDGEEGYANYWQVEALNGTILGKRILTHAHGTVEFTRSAIITIPSLVQYVIVRGHDIIHEFGGQAMIVDLINNNTHSIDQGSNNISLNGYETIFQSSSSLHTSTSYETSTVGGSSIILFIGIMIIILFRKRRK